MKLRHSGCKENWKSKVKAQFKKLITTEIQAWARIAQSV
jgi:hypothetical protein